MEPSDRREPRSGGGEGPVDCTWCRAALSAVLDGEASGGDRRAAEGHLDRCPSCRHWADRATEVTSWARTLSAGPPPDLVARTMDTWEGVARAGDPAGDPSPRLVLVASGGEPRPGSAPCGCAATCRCGCQQGAPCHCGPCAA